MPKSLHKLVKQSKATSHKELITFLASVFFSSAEMSQSKQDDNKYTAALIVQ